VQTLTYLVRRYPRQGVPSIAKRLKHKDRKAGVRRKGNSILPAADGFQSEDKAVVIASMHALSLRQRATHTEIVKV
jgi:hypothetical protein